MTRPESQTVPVEANASGTRPQPAAAGPNARQVRAKVDATRAAIATTPPLTRVDGLTPQTRACGHDSTTGIVPM